MGSRRGRGRGGRRSSGRGRRRSGGGSRREPKKEVTLEELDAEMDNYHKYEGKLDQLESAKAAGQPVLIAPNNGTEEAPSVDAAEEAAPEAAPEEDKKEEVESKEE